MTEDEKRQQKAMLLLEHQEAENHLAHLEEKAKQLSEQIAGISEWLANATKRYNDLNLTKFWSNNLRREVNIGADSEIAEAMNFDAVKQLLQEIKDARARVDELFKRKQALGLK